MVPCTARIQERASLKTIASTIRILLFPSLNCPAGMEGAEYEEWRVLFQETWRKRCPSADACAGRMREQTPGGCRHYRPRARRGSSLSEGGSLRINGNPAYLGRYREQADTGIIEVLAAFCQLQQEHIPARRVGSRFRHFPRFARNFDGTNSRLPGSSPMRGFFSAQPDRIQNLFLPGRERPPRHRGNRSLRGRSTVEDLALLNRLKSRPGPEKQVPPVKLIRREMSLAQASLQAGTLETGALPQHHGIRELPWKLHFSFLPDMNTLWMKPARGGKRSNSLRQAAL